MSAKREREAAGFAGAELKNQARGTHKPKAGGIDPAPGTKLKPFPIKEKLKPPRGIGQTFVVLL